MSQRDPEPLRNTSARPPVSTFYPVVAAVLIGLTLAALIGAALSGLFSGAGWAWPPPAQLPLVLGRWLASPDNPAAAWRTDPRPGPAVLTYLLVGLIVAAEGALWWRISAWRRRSRGRRGDHRTGLADKATVLARLGAAAVARSARRLRPSLEGVRSLSPDEAGTFFARWPGTGEGLYGTHEDSKLVVAPQRMGKTQRQAVSDVLRAPGALLATSTRFDVVELTIMDRSRRGRVWVFDPESRVPWPDKLRWNPIAGCEDFDVALRRSIAICSAMPLEDTKNGGYFSGKSEGVLAAMLHAAALSGAGLDSIWYWTTSQSYQPAQILDTHADAAPAIGSGLRNLLDSLKSTSDTSGAGGIFSTLELILRPLNSPTVMRSLTPKPRDRPFDIDDFILSGTDTLYMISRGRKNSAAPMITALMAEILHRTDILSQKPGAEQFTKRPQGDLRLDPPFRVVMDEASGITPLEDLAARLADSGGRGVQLYVYVQSLSQLRQRWGVEQATEIWDNASIKLILGGLSNAKDLQSISDLLRERAVDQASVSTGNARDQVTISPRMERALTVDAIRELGEGEALLFYRNMRAARVELPGWWDSPDIRDRVIASREETRRIVTLSQ
ncbi:type IV secretory system conjugative DNA transfer family protein [Amycolatopsis sp. cmx-4-54]|uniref:type IV secretory system conjugative DNA transfer family protein n=1 Tax=Amycolatopsis sp. cmx-4-54 TaxID=2790936 RepID=UPI003979D3BD